MIKRNALLLGLAMMLIASFSFAQVNYTANDIIIPYEGFYHPGINLGYYGPNWDDNGLADLSAGNETVKVGGVGIKSLRGSLPEGLGLTFTYDIWIDKYDYNHAVGTTDNLLFLGFASEEHKDKTDYCDSNDIPTDMFANLYEPIWDNGENGTPVNDENYYALYVYEVVSRLKDKVKFWEIWNEPGFDFTGAKGFLPPGQPGNWWENNPDPCDYKLRAPIFNYIRTLRISYEVIKSIAPDDYVVIAGLGYDSFLDALLRNTDNPDDGKVTAEYPLGAGAYFDVVGFHAYPHIDGSTRYWEPAINDFVYSRHTDAAADALEARRDARREVLENYGYDGVTYPRKEWIATEVNVPSTAFSQEWGSQEVQRNYVMKVNMKAMELDFTQLHLFLLADFKTEEEATYEFDLMGMYKSISDKLPYQQEIKESGIGLKTMSDALFGSRYDAIKTAEMNLPANVGGGAYRFDDGTYTYALWAKTQTDLSEAASATYSFPPSFNIMAMIRKEWNFSATGERLGEGPGNIQLTSAPLFLRRLEDDQDIFLDVTCNVGIEIQVTATSPEGGKFVTWEVPSAITNCFDGTSVMQTQGIENGGFFPFGAHEIQYTITNGCGDVKYCAFNVKVASTGGGIGDCNLYRWEMGFVGQFEGNKYFVSKVKKNFADAQAQAAGHGGYLVSIDSERENEFLRQQVNDLAYIGYNDIAQEGDLQWTSGKDVVFTNVADCPGCQNSEFGDAAIFNHFNGEWYFSGAEEEAFFIMELPCAEVVECICTTEYVPVCGPNGTEYSNACFAECDGIFDYSSCVEPCDLSQQQWLQDTLASSALCEISCLNSIQSFEFNDSTFVVFDGATGPCADYFTEVFTCDGTLFCQDGGIAGLQECTSYFGDNFSQDAELLWSQDSCPEPCTLNGQVWLEELTSSITCEDGFYLIESFSFEGLIYVLVDDGSSVAVDGGYIIYNCDGTLLCTEAGFGAPLCTNIFGAAFEPETTVIYSSEVECDCGCDAVYDPVCTPDGTEYSNSCIAECEGVFNYIDCIEPCLLSQQQWLQDTLLSPTLCDNSCLTTVEVMVYQGQTYLAFVGQNNICSDGVTNVYNCDGTLFCQEGSIAGLTQCTEFFGEDYLQNTDVIWEADDCPAPCEVEGQAWLEDTISNLDCTGCIYSLESFVFNDSVYVIAFNDFENCGNEPISIYDCEGVVICMEGGVQGLTECSDFFGVDIDPELTVLWSQEEECEPCEIEDMSWVEDLIAEQDCAGCYDAVIAFVWNDSTFIAQIGNESLCENAVTNVFDCNGNLFCVESLSSGSTQCFDYFGADFDPELTELWSMDEDCEECRLAEQDWLKTLLDRDDLCDDCILSIEVYTWMDSSYVAVKGDSLNCADAATTVYRCDGSIFCFEDGISGSDDCELFFDEAKSALVMWDKEIECLKDATTTLHLAVLNLFPNPTSEVLSISFELDAAETFQYRILDIAGKLISQSTMEASSGMNKVTIEVDDLIEGMYFINIVNVRTLESKALRFVKSK